MGAVAAGGAAAMGTGAFEGAFVSAEREMRVAVTGDAAAYLQLIDSSPYASYQSSGDSASELVIIMNQLNPDADTRLDDVFRVRNTTGNDVVLKILDGQESDESIGDYDDGPEDAFQIFADPDGGRGLGTRIDDGGEVTLGPGDRVYINLIAFLRNSDPDTLPDEMLVVADGTS
jgi:hypothetical protein